MSDAIEEVARRLAAAAKDESVTAEQLALLLSMAMRGFLAPAEREQSDAR